MESRSTVPAPSPLAESGFPLRHRLAIAERSIEPIPEARGALKLAEGALKRRGAIISLLGPRGTGKTQMAAILAHNCAAWAAVAEKDRVDPYVLAGWSGARYWRLGDLFADAKRAFSSGGDPLGDAAKAGLLVVDEIGETTDSAFEHRELVRLIDQRYGNLKPTILIGNLSAKELARFGESVLSRMQECGTIVECNWASLRSQA